MLNFIKISKASIITTFVFLGIFTGSSQAQYYNYQTYGNSTYVNGSDGYHGSLQTYGNSSYYHDNRGNNCTTNSYGNSTYTNCY